MSVVDADLTPNQKRTLNARRRFAEKFSTPEEKSAHFRALGNKAAAGRVLLTGDEAQALAEALKSPVDNVDVLLAPVVAKLKAAGHD